MVRTVILAVLLLLLILGLAMGSWMYFTARATFPMIEGTVAMEGVRDSVVVIRDGYGIPHIYAGDVWDLFFAQGVVTAQDRLWQMDLLRRTAAGRFSEIFGEAAVETDSFLRTLGLHRAALRDLRELDAETRGILEAYAEGVNRFMRMRAKRLPIEFRLLRYTPEPWRPEDSLGIAKVMALHLDLNWRIEWLRGQLLDRLGAEKMRDLFPLAHVGGTMAWGRHDSGFEGHSSRSARVGAEEDGEGASSLQGYLGWNRLGGGSNSWAIDGSKSSTGKPLLANDPHLSFRMPSIWYENHLVGGPYEVTGVSLPGVPMIVIGHNRRIAWGLTHLMADVQDLYVEKVHPENAREYWWLDHWEPMEVVWERIGVKGKTPGGSLEVRHTRHGPLVGRWLGYDGAVALRWTALEPSTVARAVRMLNRAEDWGAFCEALRYFDVPAQNVVYADVDGNIGYYAAGKIPIRTQGTGSTPVPGHAGAFEWAGTIPFDELPHLYNPPSHGVVAANQRIVEETYPYSLSEDWDTGHRAERILALLNGTAQFTLEDFQRMQGDTYSLSGEAIVASLEDIQSEDPEVQRALDVLRRWDAHCDRESAGATICEAVRVRLLQNTFEDELGDLFGDFVHYNHAHDWALLRVLDQDLSLWWDDVRTPEVIEGREDIIRRSVKEAVEDLEKRLGGRPETWRWGRVHRLRFEHPMGGMRLLGRFLNYGPVEVDGCCDTVNNHSFFVQRPFNVVSGVSYRQIIDLSDWSRSVSVNTTGQSGQPFYTHYHDQTALWRDGGYHPMWFEREEIEAHREGRLKIVPR